MTTNRMLVVFLCVMLVFVLACFSALNYFYPKAETPGRKFYRECLEDRYTRTQCEYMHNQMFRFK